MGGAYWAWVVEVMAIPSRRGGVGGYRALWLKGEPLWAYRDPVLIAVARGLATSDCACGFTRHW